MSLKKITFQLYSDLHLELTNIVPKIKPLAPYLFLSGDITKVSHTSFNEFFSYCNNNWEKTFYVMGNHDYWNPHSSMQHIKQEILDRFKQDHLTNIILLDNNKYSLNDELDIVGSTFWTYSPFVSKYEATMYINDYNMIRILKEGITRPFNLTPNDINNLCSSDSTYLYTYLNDDTINQNKKCIIMTHFPPQRTGTSHPKYSNQSKFMQSYFSHPDGTLNNLKNTSNIVSWISGHTHYSYDLVSVEGVRLISNQNGYTSEVLNKESGLKVDGLFTIML